VARTCALGALLALIAAPCGCASIPAGGAAIDSVRVVGTDGIDAHALGEKLATTESPRFLGLFRGVANDYSIYDPSVLQRDLARVERFYRGRGFFDAHARVARVIHLSADHVGVEIVVDEGPPVLNRELTIEGLAGLPGAVAADVRAALEHALPRGQRFDENAYGDAQAALLRALTTRGYAYATVHAEARAELPAHAIDYAFVVSPGVGCVYGQITFVGLDPDGAGPKPQEIDERVLRRVMHIREGAPYSTAEIDSSTQALLDLGVFSAVHIAPSLSDPPKPVVPLVVEVEPAQLRTVRLGGGGELDQIKTDVHALFGWEDHDLLGGLRDLSIDLKPGVVLYPTSLSDFRAPHRLFYEQHLRLQFRQPGVFEARTTGFVRPVLNVYPLLVEPDPNVSNPVVNYLEPKISVGLERRFGKHLFSTLAYNFQGEKPFTYPGQHLDTSLPTVFLSFPQLVAQLDYRDDPVHTHAGFAANLDLQFAGGPFGGTATDWRIQPDVEGYIPVAKNVTFAVTGTLGLLFPFNYGESVESGLPAGATATDVQTVYFRGFFSGGPNSNRGYPLRGVAPHGFVPFLNPATASTQAATSCDPNLVSPSALQKNPLCSSPVGGFTQWEASAELRLASSGPWGGVFFCDAGDVSQYVLFHKYPAKEGAKALRFNYLHMSCGVGARYDTSVVPIRLDIGYRIPGLQILGQSDPTKYDATFGEPPPLFNLLPIAVAFGIGESF
jgi:outer membrane protein insertion porin family/translocation and assembly module TamA